MFYNDNLETIIHESIIRVMGILYESQIVEGANMGAMMRLFQVGEEVCAQYDDVLVAFDDDFFNDYESITGIDLRTADQTVH
jgi:hypothetical protein